MTVCFYIYYYKLSHKSPKVVGNAIICLNQEYESISEEVSGEITVHQFKIHNCLGMTLDYTEGFTINVWKID